MKRFFKYILAFAAVSFAANACVEEEPFQPGESEEAGCYGVYFPAQAASGSHTYDPTMEKSITINVARKNTDGAINVPFEIITDSDVFECADKTVSFEDGQTESSVIISFPKIETGKECSFSIQITDPQYASKYNATYASLDCSVLCVEWKKFYGPEATDATSEGHIYEIAWEEDYPANMYYYETSYPNIRFCYIENAWRTDEKNYDYTFYWDTKTNNLYVPNQYIGVTTASGSIYTGAACDFYNGYNGWGVVCPGEEYFSWAPAWISKNDFLQPHYDGNGNFYLADWLYLCDAAGVPTGRGYQFGGDTYADSDLFMAAGFNRKDYSLDVSVGFTEKGVVPVKFKFGADVASIKYAAYPGALNTVQLSAKLEAIISGEENAAELSMEDAAVGLSFDESGIYTLVAVAFDDAGKYQEDASEKFNYVASGDEERYSVALSCGVASAERYKDANTDNTLEMYVFGEDIVEAKMALFSAIDLATSAQACIASLMEEDSAGADVIDAINGKGYSCLVGKLLPGTEYYAVVYANNGYSESITISSKGFFTTGDPLPIYMNYTAYDITSFPETSEGFFGTYNYYATDFYGDLGMREYMGKVTISDSAAEDLPADDDGIITEYVDIKGLFSTEAAYYGFDDTVTWEFYDGVLYQIPTYFDQTKNGDYYPALLYLTADMMLYPAANGYTLLGGFVDNGQIAFVDATLGDYGFNGWLLRFFSDDQYSTSAGNVSAYIDPFLIAPEVDESGLAKQSVVSRNQLNKISAKLSEPRTNYVETERGRIRSIIDSVKKQSAMPKAATSFTTVESRREIETVNVTAKAIDGQIREKRELSYSLRNLGR